MYFVYILCSEKVKRYYIGVSQDLVVRLKAHNAGGTRSTKPYRPWRVVYVEPYQSKKDAYKREYFLKSPKGYLEKRRILESL